MSNLKFTGTVSLTIVAKGSKSERKTHIIFNDEQRYILRQRGGSSMYDSYFEQFEDNVITVSGTIHNLTFLVDSLTENKL